MSWAVGIVGLRWVVVTSRSCGLAPSLATNRERMVMRLLSTQIVEDELRGFPLISL